MDDVIIIILTLVLTVVAAINQSKKKKQQGAPTSEGEPDFWEEILKGGKPYTEPEQNNEPDMTREPVVFRDPVKQRPAREMAKITTVPSRKVKADNKTNSYFNPDEDGGRLDEIMKYSHSKHAEEALSLDAVESEPILEDFTLRKAVIYSEIINPKYF
jgi:hypothetical protein